ncbi:YbdD/YjiX family protein [Dactylosporangium sp. CA-152071]|uniref:YbdD/YjiX family protein n=1 Tax=Dactylosporangium sp. CA-152071 TaxID=3239933 RepID=UPI003D8E2EC6
MRARHLLSRLWWYLRELVGETSYDHYLAHQQQHCRDGSPLTRREFEHLRTASPVRCC